MKINLMTDYAVRVICSIYENEKGIITSNYISENEKIPHGVLMKVLRELRIKEIIVSHQGRGEISGGYSLAKSIKEITFLDILEIMEGAIMLENIGQRNSKPQEIVGVKNEKITKEYKRISQVLRKELGKNSLYEILNEKNEEKPTR
jgi:Predicted transcriptional regulator